MAPRSAYKKSLLGRHLGQLPPSTFRHILRTTTHRIIFKANTSRKSSILHLNICDINVCHVHMVSIVLLLAFVWMNDAARSTRKLKPLLNNASYRWWWDHDYLIARTVLVVLKLEQVRIRMNYPCEVIGYSRSTRNSWQITSSLLRRCKRTP